MRNKLLLSLLCAIPMPLTAQESLDVKFDKEHTIDYLVVYDKSNPDGFIESRGGREAYAQEIVDSINAVFKNSKLDYHFRVAGVHFLNDYQAPSIEAGHNEIANNEEVKRIRRQTKADIVVLLTETFGDFNSGLADHQDNALHTDAYSCVNLRMAASSYTAAHEAAHILGAYHARGSEEHTPSDHPWAAAYYTQGYRTVLCSMVPGTTVPVYSGPDSYWKGVRMGDEQHDNVRMLRQNLPRAVHFGEWLDTDRYYASADQLTYSKHPQKGAVTITGNVFFNISTSAHWIKITSETWGTVRRDVTFELEPNTTGKDRTATLLVSGDASFSKEIKITQTAADLVIDCEQGAYLLKQNNFLDKVDFIRHFDNTEWQTLYLPLFWRHEEWKDFFDIASIQKVEETEADEMVMTIMPVNEGTLKPNTPYFIKAKKTGSYKVSLTHVNTFAADTTPFEFALKDKRLVIHGNYGRIAGQEIYNNQWLTVENGQIERNGDVDARLNAFRWYISATDNNGNSLTLKQKIRIVNDSEENTGIIAVPMEKGASCVYDLNGRPVNLQQKGIHKKREVYIINGKKMIR